MKKTQSFQRGASKTLRDFRMPPSVTDDFIKHYLQTLDCPRSLAVWILYESREHNQLVELKSNPQDFETPEAFRDSYLATKFLSKANFLETGIDRKQVALDKFFEFEENCRVQNRYFQNLLSHPQLTNENVCLLSETRRKIASILGTYQAEEFVNGGNWGPGVSTLVKGEEVSAFNKFRSETGITREMYSLVSEWFHIAYPLWKDAPLTLYGEDRVTIESGNTVLTVPKDSKTERVIACEPGLNLWFQQSIGKMLVKRLRRVGIDLQTQENNQHAAYLSSKTDELATVDFSSASDSISSAVVEDLMPPRWFTLMNSTRSHFRQADIAPIRWNKFSSMGNAYTFPLQSLIFYACAVSVCSRLGLPTNKICVFGDDVLLPRKAYSLFSSFTAFLGFTVNKQKSFSGGYFRESCGSHYYDGVDCKPFYLKDRIRSVESLYQTYNSVRLLSHRCMSNLACDYRFKRTCDFLMKKCPKLLQFRVPSTAPNAGFISNFDEAVPVRAKHQLDGFRYTGLITRGVSLETEDPALLLARLWVTSTQSHLNTYDLRGRKRIAVKRGMFVQRWYQLGPWV
jgi:hypothetical protein